MAELNKEELIAKRSAAEAAANNAKEAATVALREKNLVEYGKAMRILNEKVKEWNGLICDVEYANLAEKEFPVIEAVKMFFVDTKRVIESRDDNGDVNGILFENRKTKIDLERFCVKAGLKTDWARDAEKLLALLVLRETDVYSVKPSELADKSFYFISKVKEKKKGETPDSNTQIVKALQDVIDGAIFIDNGKGKNKYKCTNHDIAFIQDAVTRMDTKKKCAIAMLNERQFKGVMMSVFAHCLGEVYSVVPAKVKSK